MAEIKELEPVERPAEELDPAFTIEEFGEALRDYDDSAEVTS
jgi:hypothetical protein